MERFGLCVLFIASVAVSAALPLQQTQEGSENDIPNEIQERQELILLKGIADKLTNGAYNVVEGIEKVVSGVVGAVHNHEKLGKPLVEAIRKDPDATTTPEYYDEEEVEETTIEPPAPEIDSAVITPSPASVVSEQTSHAVTEMKSLQSQSDKNSSLPLKKSENAERPEGQVVPVQGILLVSNTTKKPSRLAQYSLSRVPWLRKRTSKSKARVPLTSIVPEEVVSTSEAP